MIVTEVGEGVSIINAAEDIDSVLNRLLATDDAVAQGGGRITVLHHWPADQSFDSEESYDQVAIIAG